MQYLRKYIKALSNNPTPKNNVWIWNMHSLTFMKFGVIILNISWYKQIMYPLKLYYLKN